MAISAADVKTTHATSYLKQLCRHWSHRFPVEFNDERGRIELPTAVCTLEAQPELLLVRVEIQEGGDQSRIETVVAEHLQRFGFKETLVFDWVRTDWARTD